MDAITGYFGFGVSMVSAFVTFYFWIMKANKEQPRLKLYQAEGQFGGHAQSSCSDPVKLVFEVKSLVANYSTMPNALLGVQATPYGLA